MAESPEELEARLREENPVYREFVHDAATGESVTTEYVAPDPTYEAYIDQAVATETKRQANVVAEEAEKQEGQGILAKADALEVTADRLDSAEALTTTQLRHFMAEHMRVTSQVIRYIHKRST